MKIKLIKQNDDYIGDYDDLAVDGTPLTCAGCYFNSEDGNAYDCCMATEHLRVLCVDDDGVDMIWVKKNEQ